ADIVLGQTFTLSDGVDEVTFEYVKNAVVGPLPSGNVPVRIAAFDDESAVANRIAEAINRADVQVSRRLDITAASLPTSARVDLFGETVVVGGTATSAAAGDAIARIRYDEIGDRNRFRDQGQILLHSNQITDALEYGIRVGSGPGAVGAVRNLR
ncbi:MAG: hypothetical protein ACC645_22585, partial [Pirellulales bacterium]